MDDFHRIAMIGMGLIGGSLALALKHFGCQSEIIGSDKNKETLEEAIRLGAIDFATVDSKEAVLDADLVIIAVSVGQYEEIFQEISPFLKKGALVTDVGSVKGHIIELASRYLPRHVEFLGGHPMAGSEKEGIHAASPYLYENAYYFLTPTDQNSDAACLKLESLIRSLGAYPIRIDAWKHDQIVAKISHIPHLSAVALVNLLEQSRGLSYLPFVGGGFRDTTRIASGSPYLWRDILLFNKKEIIHEIRLMQNILEEFCFLLEEEKDQEILQILKQAKEIRDQIPLRFKDGIPPIYEIIVTAADRPGTLAEITRILGEKGVNIKEIEILHSREYQEGAIRLGFESKEEEKKANSLLAQAGYFVANAGK
jgi:prephenate dehydrogenase